MPPFQVQVDFPGCVAVEARSDTHHPLQGSRGFLNQGAYCRLTAQARSRHDGVFVVGFGSVLPIPNRSQPPLCPVGRAGCQVAFRHQYAIDPGKNQVDDGAQARRSGSDYQNRGRHCPVDIHGSAFRRLVLLGRGGVTDGNHALHAGSGTRGDIFVHKNFVAAVFQAAD